jgi:predicted nucleic acid-binding protein
MTFEAGATFGWKSKVLKHLKQSPAATQSLTRFRQSVERIPQMGVHLLDVRGQFVLDAAAISQQTGLLHNDALIVAVMRHHGLANLASEDADFDRVPGITRYAPA